VEEFALIRALARRFAGKTRSLIRGIGDDAAVIATTSPMWWHVTTDLLTEGVHFDLQTASPESVGYRSAIANLSDIAAMGATPRYLLISLAVPSGFNRKDIFSLYTGLLRACHPHGVALIGGDTSASRAGLFINITLMGSTAPGMALLRRGARIGDHIYATGTLGDSLAGLQLLMHPVSRTSAQSLSPSLGAAHRHVLIQRHLHPSARIEEGHWLSTRQLATAAIDLSDGLSGDLRHICEESRVGAEIDLDKLPISTACRAYAHSRGLQPAQLALTGGEDYELLFTAPPAKQPDIMKQARAHRFHVTQIGTIRPRRFGIRIQNGDGTSRPMPITSYEHFR